MQIRDVLALHNSCQPAHFIPEILGDGFLLEHNSVYRLLRERALAIGCRFTEAWPQYLLLPFHELPAIVMEKKIPFVPSGRMLSEIEKRRPHVFHSEEMRMPESYHLHESAHVIAEDLFAKVALHNTQEKILKAILCESFANTVDALVCVAVKDETHQFFLEHNCYMKPVKKHIDLMSRLIQDLGFKTTAILTLFAYVHANFLRESFSEGVIRDLVRQYSPDKDLGAKLMKDCLALAAMGEKLDPQFRVQTTEAYFKMEGFEGEIFELLDFPFMEVYGARKDFQHVVEAMAGLLYS